MKYRHVLVTRYSITNGGSPVHRMETHGDLFDAQRLAYRFALFRHATFPSVAEQYDQDFDWFVLVSIELPANHRAELAALLTTRPRTHLVILKPGTRFWRSSWLRAEGSINEPALATTSLDDDDALPRTFMGDLHRAIDDNPHCLMEKSPFIFGFKAPLQWDLNLQESTPLGTVARWHRRWRDGESYPLFCGLTLFVPNARYDLCVLGVEHVSSEAVFAPTFSPSNKLQRNGMWLLRAAAAGAGGDWRQWRPETNFQALDDLCPAPLVINHAYNVQAERRDEPKPGAAVVSGPDTFPDINFNWDELIAFVQHHSDNTVAYPAHEPLGDPLGLG